MIRPLLFLTSIAASAVALEPCRIEVVDKDNGWPVPLVELRTTNKEVLVTDNAGVVAFDLPEFMGTETWLEVFSHGYEVPEDPYGHRGVRFTPKPGGKFRIEIERKQIAKRLGRLTGAGIFAEAQKLGGFKDWKESGITGSDTVQMFEYQGRLFWLWGDTDLPGYPLGIFDTSAATTTLKPLISLKPPTGIVYDYFRNEKDRPRGVAPMPSIPGNGPVWLGGLVTLPDAQGKPHLVATYSKIEKEMSPKEFGLCEWNPRKKIFEKLMTFWTRSGDEKGPERPYPDGHAVFWKDSRGQTWLYLDGPPKFKCPATYEAWKDRSQWRNVENPTRFQIAGEDGEVEVASGSIAWSNYRKKWILILQQKFGTSAFGEVWYVEGDTPEGPWGKAVKVATHKNYTFYNVQIDWQLTDPNEPILLFEGTYVTTFTDNQVKTPRYDYNQVLYRIDLNDPDLKPAQRN